MASNRIVLQYQGRILSCAHRDTRAPSPATSRNSRARPTDRLHDAARGNRSVLLTSLPAAEIDPVSLRRTLEGQSLHGRGVVLRAPHGAVLLRPIRVFIGTSRVQQIAGIALSTTSVAVVYAVIGRNRPQSFNNGHRLISPRASSTDLGTVSGSGRTLRELRLATLVFVLVTAVSCSSCRRSRWVVATSVIASASRR